MLESSLAGEFKPENERYEDVFVALSTATLMDEFDPAESSTNNPVKFANETGSLERG